MRILENVPNAKIAAILGLIWIFQKLRFHLTLRVTIVRWDFSAECAIGQSGTHRPQRGQSILRLPARTREEQQRIGGWPQGRFPTEQESVD